MAALPNIPEFAAIDFVVWDDSREMARQALAMDISPVELSDIEIGHLVVFLESLTGASANKGPLGVPDTVPSGLSVDRAE